MPIPCLPLSRRREDHGFDDFKDQNEEACIDFYQYLWEYKGKFRIGVDEYVLGSILGTPNMPFSVPALNPRSYEIKIVGYQKRTKDHEKN